MPYQKCKIIFFSIPFVYLVTLFLYKEAELFLIHTDIRKNYNLSAKQYVAEAHNKLKENQDDWLVCTEMGLSLFDLKSPEIMAQYFTYYKYGNSLCKRWWKWGSQKCNYLKTLRIESKNFKFLEQRIALCDLAKSNEK